MNEPIIELHSVSKRYPLVQSRRTVIGSLRSIGKPARSEPLWALRDISLTVHKGETVGIIGENGSGKTTLLRIINGITRPTDGSVVCRGTVAGLLELGSGFHPEMSGRENIFLNAALYGMDKKTVRELLDDIISFSGLHTFIDSPLKTYSQGMMVRLGFSIAMHMRPDIFLIDDTLSVGDEEFQRKCLKKIEKLRELVKTVIIVSHDMNSVSRFCGRGILLKAGTLVKTGPMQAIVVRYVESVGAAEAVACIDAGRLSIVFNAGKLILLWDGTPLTKHWGGYLSFLRFEKWISSWHGRWEIRERTPRQFCAEGFFCGSDIRTRITISLTEETCVQWSVHFFIKPDCGVERIAFGLMLSEQYDHYLDETRIRPIESADTLSERWQDIYASGEQEPLLAVTGGDNEKIPAILGTFSGNGASYNTLIQRAGRDLDAVVLQMNAQMYPSTGNSPESGRGVTCAGNFSLLTEESFRQRIAEEDLRRRCEWENVSIRLSGKKLHIGYNGTELTAPEAMTPGIYYREQFWNALEGEWTWTPQPEGTVLLSSYFDHLQTTLHCTFRIGSRGISWDCALSGKNFGNEQLRICLLITVRTDYTEYRDFNGITTFAPPTGRAEIIPNRFPDVPFICLSGADPRELPAALLLETRSPVELSLINAETTHPARRLSCRSLSGNSFTGQLLFQKDGRETDCYLREKREQWENNFLIRNDPLCLQFGHTQIRCFDGEHEFLAKQGIIGESYFNDSWLEKNDGGEYTKNDETSLSFSKTCAEPSGTEHWLIRLLPGRLIEWTITLRLPEKKRPRCYRMGILVKSSYTQWHSSYESGRFAGAVRRHTVHDRQSRLIAVGEPNELFPALLFAIETDCDCFPQVEDAGEYRIIYFTLDCDSEAAVKSGETEPIRLKGIIQLVDAAAAVAAVAADCRKRFGILERYEYRIESFHRGSLRLFHQERLISAETGFFSETPEASRQRTTLSDRKAYAIDGDIISLCPQEDQQSQWQVALSPGNIRWTVIPENGTLPLRVCFSPSPDYTQWINGFLYDPPQRREQPGPYPENLFCPVLTAIPSRANLPVIFFIPETPSMVKNHFIKDTTNGLSLFFETYPLSSEKEGAQIGFRIETVAIEEWERRLEILRRPYTTLAETGPLRLCYAARQLHIFFRDIRITAAGGIHPSGNIAGQRFSLSEGTPGTRLIRWLDAAGKKTAIWKWVQQDNGCTLTVVSSRQDADVSIRLAHFFRSWVADFSEHPFESEPIPVTEEDAVAYLGIKPDDERLPHLLINCTGTIPLLECPGDRPRITFPSHTNDRAGGRRRRMKIDITCLSGKKFDAYISNDRKTHTELLNNGNLSLKLESGHVHLYQKDRKLSGPGGLGANVRIDGIRQCDEKKLLVESRHPTTTSIRIQRQGSDFLERWEFRAENQKIEWKVIVSAGSADLVYQQSVALNKFYTLWNDGWRRGLLNGTEHNDGNEHLIDAESGVLALENDDGALSTLIVLPGAASRSFVEKQNDETAIIVQTTGAGADPTIIQSRLYLLASIEAEHCIALNRKSSELLRCGKNSLRLERGLLQLYRKEQRLSGRQGLSSSICVDGRWQNGAVVLSVERRTPEEGVLRISRSGCDCREEWTFRTEHQEIIWTVRFSGDLIPATVHLGMDVSLQYDELRSDTFCEDCPETMQFLPIPSETTSLIGTTVKNESLPGVFLHAREPKSSPFIRIEQNHCVLRIDTCLREGESPTAGLRITTVDSTELPPSPAEAGTPCPHLRSGFDLTPGYNGLKLIFPGSELSDGLEILPQVTIHHDRSPLHFYSPVAEHIGTDHYRIRYRTLTHQLELIMDIRDFDGYFETEISLIAGSALEIGDLKLLHLIPMKLIGEVKTAQQSDLLADRGNRPEFLCPLFDDRSEFFDIDIRNGEKNHLLRHLPDPEYLNEWGWTAQSIRLRSGSAPYLHYGLMKLIGFSGWSVPAGTYTFPKIRYALSGLEECPPKPPRQYANRSLLSKGALQLIYSGGRFRLLWENREITKAFGLHTAFSHTQHHRLNSNRAQWEFSREHNDSETLSGVLMWKDNYLIQRFRIQLFDPFIIQAQIETHILQTDIHRLTVALMLSDAYEKWTVQGETPRPYPSAFTRDCWPQLAATTHPIQTFSSDRKRYPPVSFRSMQEGAESIQYIENSNELFSCRVLSVQTPPEILLPFPSAIKTNFVIEIHAGDDACSRQPGFGERTNYA